MIAGLALALLIAAISWRRPVLATATLLFFEQNDALILWIGGFPIQEVLVILVLSLSVARMTVGEAHEIFRAGFPVFLFLAGLLAIFYYTGLLAVDTELAHKETNRLITKLALVAVLCVSVRSRGDLGIVIYTLIFSTAVSAGLTIFEYFRGEPLFDIPIHKGQIATWDGVFRPSGASKEVPSMSASMMLAGVTIAAILLIRSGRSRLFFATVVLLGLTAIIMTVTRSAIMTCGVILVVMLFYYRKDPAFPWLVRVTAVMVVLIALTLPSNVVSKFTAISNVAEDSTVARRLGYQIVGFDLVRQNPLFGVGVGNYVVHYSLDVYRFAPGRGEEVRALHNNYLQYAAEIGIVGFSAFLGLLLATGSALLSAIRRASGTVRDYSEAVLFAYFGILLQLFFLSSKFLFSFWVIVGLAIVVRRIALRDFAPECSNTPKDLPDTEGFDKTGDTPVTYNSGNRATRKELSTKARDEDAFVFLNGPPLAKACKGADRGIGLNVPGICLSGNQNFSTDVKIDRAK